jgi:hypothetical protein
MSITTINQYKIFCVTENKFVIGEGLSPPTVCYNNNTHTVNPNSWQLVLSVSNSQVIVKQNQVSTGGNFWIKDIVFSNIAPQSTQTVDYTFDVLCNVYCYDFFVNDTNAGDYITIIVRPNTIVGLIGANMNIGDTTMIGPSGLLTYGYPGYELTVTDGTNIDVLGRILSIDADTGVVTFTNASTHTYSSTNTEVILNYYIMKNYTISGYGQVRYGDNILTAAVVPAGTTVRYIYQNNSISGDLTDAPKKFRISFTAQF